MAFGARFRNGASHEYGGVHFKYRVLILGMASRHEYELLSQSMGFLIRSMGFSAQVWASQDLNEVLLLIMGFPNLVWGSPPSYGLPGISMGFSTKLWVS
ncbi:hypothetical protein ACA29_15015 [Lederbergia galactosidilytica]|uniref:Uncharacterized protein n=1 Tax=Lederbergia galactosidilytica TaxID=217031 RepID=A0A0Q9Y841_9BACI|nr:hypothetical protein ACA29_15015 [Lederbergia galactosidilytica]